MIDMFTYLKEGISLKFIYRLFWGQQTTGTCLFVSKALLEIGTPICFCTIYGCFQATVLCYTNHMAGKPKIHTVWSFKKKSLDPWIYYYIGKLIFETWEFHVGNEHQNSVVCFTWAVLLVLPYTSHLVTIYLNIAICLYLHLR